jgi:hypothetical protein
MSYRGPDITPTQRRRKAWIDPIHEIVSGAKCVIDTVS